jgi:predicted nucleotidyltransferase
MIQAVTEEKIKKVTKKIVDEFQPEKIILFGSQVWGKANKDSDIDLFIVKRSSKKRIDRAREVRLKLFGHKFPAMDILVYTPEEVERSINEYKNLFIEDILRHGRVLYVKPENPFTIKLPKRPLKILH